MTQRKDNATAGDWREIFASGPDGGHLVGEAVKGIDADHSGDAVRHEWGRLNADRPAQRVSKQDDALQGLGVGDDFDIRTALFETGSGPAPGAVKQSSL